MAKLVHEVFETTVKRHGDRTAIREKRGGRWVDITWKRYHDDVRAAARAMIAIGLEPGQGVAILGYNCLEWLVADVGAIFAGGVPAGIYTTSSPEQAEYITAHCDAAIAFGEDRAQVEKFVQLRDRLPKLRAIVQMKGKPTHPNVLSWDEFLAKGPSVPESRLDARLAAQKSDDAATLIYTSGTTADPKAVMITHTNITWTADAVQRAMGYGSDDVSISYLPLSHIAEQMLTIHIPMMIGCPIAFAESIEKLGEALVEIRPNSFLGVPRVWEKIQAKMQGAGQSAPKLRKKIVAWARDIGLRAGYADQNREARPLLYPLAERLVFSKVRDRLGLDRARFCVTSAAPISRDTLDYFLSLGIPILEVYGMSECTGPATYSPPDRYKTGKAGVVIPGAEIKIAEDGEVCMRGPHVFKGYYKDPAATKAMIDSDGWLHSGDIGTLDADGFLQITDRKKELLITAGGENVAPQAIEGLLKAVPVVAQAVVIGDRQKYLAALITLDPERVAVEAELAGSPARTVADAAKCSIFQTHLQKQVDQVNEKLARVQTVKKFTVLPTEFTIEGGELTPTMKIKRRIINQKYAKEIELLYA